METPVPPMTQNIDVSLLPYREPLRTWAGHGTNSLCNGCGKTIRAHEIEYEIELPAGSPTRTIHFHFVCYRDWTGRGIR